MRIAISMISTLPYGLEPYTGGKWPFEFNGK